MKKILLAIILLLSISIASFAQLSGGIKGGINLVNQKWESSISGFGSNTSKFEGTSFHIGGYLNYSVNDVLSWQPELLFNQIKVSSDGEELKFNYLSLPVMIGYGIESNKFILQAGPQLGILLSSDPSEMKEDGYLKSLDFSFALGAMLNLEKVNFGIRYSMGILNIADSKLEEESEAELEDFLGEDVDLDVAIKNNNLQLFIGFKLFSGNQ